ncbi:PorP/SprF family type IX secretion system membrane protein [Zhouia amylolytica]|uniref:Bacteroidetes-specific membrane protein n=1 Tax=Zhouia amylolytica AD3 TaxID=1286632 RepID=W2UN06_9FLAO|nr:type IX secretion system membrane protein PorP/SprF [Zhouia amylolytica]ETN94851.1 hypothetical protein P278_27940 [Zhouia amylolytica AD3]
MKQYITFLLMIFGFVNMVAQQTPQFTQYLYNPTSINPAFAGSTNSLSAIVMHRSQWTGFDGAPSTNTVSIHSPLRNEKVGLGFSFINDGLGNETFNYLYGDFSYTIQFNEKIKMAFGLKAGFTQYALSDQLLNKPDVQNDPYFNAYNDQWNPNIGVGMYMFGERWYGAVSVPQMLSNKYIDAASDGVEYKAAEKSSLYITGGYVFTLSNEVVFKPTTMLRATDGVPMSLDFGTNFMFYNKIWLGVNYRLDSFDTLGALGSFKIGNNLQLGYAYEFPASGIRPYTGGTHEFFLRYDFKTIINKGPTYF